MESTNLQSGGTEWWNFKRYEASDNRPDRATYSWHSEMSNVGSQERVKFNVWQNSSLSYLYPQTNANFTSPNLIPVVNRCSTRGRKHDLSQCGSLRFLQKVRKKTKWGHRPAAGEGLLLDFISELWSGH